MHMPHGLLEKLASSAAPSRTRWCPDSTLPRARASSRMPRRARDDERETFTRGLDAPSASIAVARATNVRRGEL